VNNERQRVIDCLERRGSVIPWQMDMTAGFARKVCAELGCVEAEQAAGNHLCRAKYKQNKPLATGCEQDIFGVTWTRSKDGGDVGVVTGYPLAEPQFGDYVFPEIRKEFARELARGLEKRKGERFTMFSITMGFFERAWSLRTMEGILTDMLCEERFCYQLFDSIEAHHSALLDEVLDYDFDGLYFGDDWGQQQGLMMGPRLWRKYIKPGVSRLFEKAKRSGKRICLHSCGDLREIFPDLIEMGVDIYNTLQPEIYNLQETKREYGKHIAFYGGISTQQFLPFASADEVYERACRVRDTLGGAGGGYILAPTHALTDDIPVVNMLAMVRAAKGGKI
jgi:uroporphyrinogen decarboxylase